MSNFSRCIFKVAIFSTHLEVAIAMSSFINEGYDEGFALEFNVSMLLEIMALVRSYIPGTMKYKAKLEGKYM